MFAAMTAHPSDADVQSYGCTVLHHMRCSTVNLPLVVKAGGIEMIDKAMTMHPSGARLQAEGCGALFEIALHAGNCARVAMASEWMTARVVFATQLYPTKAGGIEAMISGMNRQLAACDYQHFGCKVLELRADDEVNGKLIVKAGGIEAVIRALNFRNCCDVLTQVMGCNILATIAIQSHAARVAGSDGIEALVTALRQNSCENLKEVQWSGCRALFQLGSLSKALRNQVGAAGGLTRALSGLAELPSDELV